MPQRISNPFQYGAYPTDPAWGAVAGNLVQAIFGDPEAAAQAQLRRSQMASMEAEARVNNAKGSRMESENDRRLAIDPNTFFNMAYLPQDSGPMAPAIPVAPVAVGNAGMAAPAAVPVAPGNWVNPVAGARLSSGFGPRAAPMAGASRNHGGIDLAAAMGSPVLAAGGGTVLDAWNDTIHGGGNSVRVQHPDGSITGYAHLNDFNVRKGDQVTAGQQIGGVGQSGRATGPHLHLVRRQNIWHNSRGRLAECGPRLGA